jgi:hypothetical protein
MTENENNSSSKHVKIEPTISNTPPTKPNTLPIASNSYIPRNDSV